MNVLLFLAATLAADELPYLENCTPNPSFEEDRNRDTSPDGWQAMAFDSPAQLAWEQEVAHTGDRSLRIRDSHRAGETSDWKRCTGRWVSSRLAIQPGSEYTLEVWIKTEEVTGQAYAHLAWQRGSGWLSEVGTERLTGTSDWQKLSISAVAPEKADTLVVSMNLSRSKGTAWFDDVRVSGRSQQPPRVQYLFRDTADWFPFEFPLDDTNLDRVDLTGLLDAPAGKHGFVTARPDGHFYFEDGTRARFFGTNVGGQACAPEKARAPVIAARLAKYGANMLRLHSLDGRWGPLIDYRAETSQELDADALDRVDFFVAELKKRGIYVYMDLLDYRWFRTADGVSHGDDFTHNWQGSMKGASIFDERMIELQKDYATKLLTHRNPYTGLRYVDDPAVAVVETTNENSIFYFFLMSDLSLPFYREKLTARWNGWLLDRHGDRAALAEAWTEPDGNSALLPDEDPAEGTVAIPFGMLSRIRSPEADKFDPLVASGRVGDLLRFFTGIQHQYYESMYGHLKRIGVRVPIAGTNQTFVVADTFVDADRNDFMSRNQYWRHPHRNAKPFFKFSNEPLLRVDLSTQRNPLSVIASTSVEGKPQAVAEYNFPWPNEYRAEGWILSAAYACLQDWDLFLLFSYDLEDPRLSMFRSQSDPARWGEFAAAALLFHRHDVAPGRNEVHVLQSPADRYAPRPDTRYAQYTEFRFLTFLSKVRNAFVEDVYRGNADAILATGRSADVRTESRAEAIRLTDKPWEEWLYPQFVAAAQAASLPGYDRVDATGKRFRSDTGELALDYGCGLFTINTSRTQAAVGFLAERGPIELDGLRVDCDTPFATIIATSLDGQPIGTSRRMLLTAVARAENTAQGYWPPSDQQRRWSAVAWMLPGEGRLPVIAEPVRARVAVRVPAQATVHSLDATGKRQARLEAENDSGVVRFDPAQAKSIWCEIVVE